MSARSCRREQTEPIRHCRTECEGERNKVRAGAAAATHTHSRTDTHWTAAPMALLKPYSLINQKSVSHFTLWASHSLHSAAINPKHCFLFYSWRSDLRNNWSPLIDYGSQIAYWPAAYSQSFWQIWRSVKHISYYIRIYPVFSTP